MSRRHLVPFGGREGLAAPAAVQHGARYQTHTARRRRRRRRPAARYRRPRPRLQLCASDKRHRLQLRASESAPAFYILLQLGSSVSLGESSRAILRLCSTKVF